MLQYNILNINLKEEHEIVSSDYVPMRNHTREVKLIMESFKGLKLPNSVEACVLGDFIL